MVAGMRSRFLDLWSRLGGRAPERVWLVLEGCYREPGRHFHNLWHIRRCLRVLDLARPVVPQPEAVELALWCHDVIYVPGDRRNEERSAQWLLEHGAGVEVAGKAAAIIRATTHCEVPRDTDTAFAVDIDLSGLARSPNGFRADGERLRRERPDLALETYHAGEARFLSLLLAKPRIYHTDCFHRVCEQRARRNLERRLRELCGAASAPNGKPFEPDVGRP